MLVVKIDVEKDKAVLQRVVELLSEFDTVSVAWEDEQPQVKVDMELRSGATGDDLAKNVSAVIDRMERRAGGR